MKYKTAITGGLIGVFLATGLLFFMGATQASDSQKVLEGVSFIGQNLSGLERESGIKEIASLEKDYLSTPVILEYQDRAWQIAPASLGVSLDAEKIMEKALKVGKEGSFIDNWREKSRIRTNGVDLVPVLKLDREMFDHGLDNLTADLIILPVDAGFAVTKADTVEIIPGREGVLVDKEKAARDLLSVLENNRVVPRVELSLKKAQPDVTTEEVREYGLDTLLGSYTTRFDASVTDRAFNVRVAAGALDNLLVPPGKETSFNKVVGPRSSEAGYKNAKVIVNNELVDGLGGGVCQVSTTLYNAVLMSGLEVVTRKNHSLPVAYAPAGRDATVAYDYIDFVFRNNTDKYLYIKTYTGGGKVTVKIYGNSQARKDIIIKTKTVETYDYKVVYEPDPTLAKGTQKVKKEGVKGAKIIASRIIEENGASRLESLPASLYNPQNQIVLVGTGESVSPVRQAGGTAPGSGPDSRKNGQNEQVTGEAGAGQEPPPPQGGIVPPSGA
ncbi:vancomycin B-type resistance protein VanW [Desulfocucumis palustris]|uniref:Vancomycin B-type resistance protein VanW n=1 Tax=Desulfocucumis palustris TaxID=1898651 RepID=A0A2L2XDE1_9FIRM|nr:VanW family protein [Desulfocucumis palustris]GBF34245.1 vancomycin B-type resistance protein VanW [Desulfocucumis palustris]